MMIRVLRDLLNCCRLAMIFLLRVVQANLTLARDIIFRPQAFHHAFLAIDISSLGRGKKVLLGYMISLTPGTLVLDYGGDDELLYIQSIYGDDDAKIRRQIATFVKYLESIPAGAGERKGDIP